MAVKSYTMYVVIAGALLLAPLHAAAEQAKQTVGNARANDPATAFWKSPSPRRLVDLGRATRGNSMRPYKHLNSGDVAKVPRNATFDAARKRMQAGLVLPVEPANWRGKPVPASAMPHGAVIVPNPVKPSFFKKQAEVRLASESGPEDAAAVLGSRVSMTFSGKPMAWAPHHDGPAVAGLTGFGDVGMATLHFDPPLTVFAVQRNGLVSATAVRKTESYGEGGEEHCSEENYTAAGLNGRDYGGALTFGDQPVKGYPEATWGSNPYVTFVTTLPMSVRKVEVSTRAGKAPSSTGAAGATEPLALHEVDLDRDGVADILVWERTRAGEISEEPVFDRSYYVNIAGQWYHAGDTEQAECT